MSDYEDDGFRTPCSIWSDSSCFTNFENYLLDYEDLSDESKLVEIIVDDYFDKLI